MGHGALMNSAANLVSQELVKLGHMYCLISSSTITGYSSLELDDILDTCPDVVVCWK